MKKKSTEGNGMSFLNINSFRRMKLILFLVFVTFFQLSAVNSYAQETSINLKLSNVSLKEAIQAIEKQTEFVFFYSTEEIDLTKRVDVNIRKGDIESILKDVFSDYSYRIENRKILLTPNPRQRVHKITGTVKDHTGESVIGANISVRGTTSGTITDIDGKFTLEVPSDNVEIVVSYIGYRQQVIALKGKTSLDVVLTEDTQSLNEVVVVGYGSQKKVNLTGAVTSVKMDEVLGNRPVASAIQALEGAIPGMQISSNNGKPGSGMNYNIRGVTSINNPDAKPLVLVDNVPMDLDMLDPNDIESISVLKDAASAAIYGARAAFGIILVTTKKGQKDSPIRFNYSNNFAFSKPATLPQKVSPYETVKVYDDISAPTYYAGQSTGKWLTYLDEYAQGLHPEGVVLDGGTPYNLAPTDVYKDMMDKFGFQQQHNLSISGGGSKASYRISFGMVNNDGILITDKDTYSRYNVSSFVSLDATRWLTGQLDIRYSDSKTSTAMTNAENNNQAIWAFASNYQPMGPLGYGHPNSGDTEELVPYGSPRNLIELGNPKMNRSNSTRILGRIILKPLKELEVVGEYSFYRTWASESTSPMIFDYLLPTSNEKKKTRTNTVYSMSQNFSTNNAINIYATYKKTFADSHNISVMGGFNQEEYYYELLAGSRQDLINQDLPSLGLATGTLTNNDNFQEYALRSLFYRVNYDYKGRYLFEANGRYDGSSRFNPDHRYGFFPSFSAGWRISEESFMEFTKDYLTQLKLRASWGSIGNQNVDYYGYIATMNALTQTSNTKSNWVLPGESDYVTSIGAPGLISANYTWEKAETFDVGFDLGLFDNRLETVFNWYQRDTKEMLAPSKALPGILGTSAPKSNAASLRTKGWEISLSWRSNIGKDFRYNLGFNLYDSKAEITKYDNPAGALDSDNTINLREGMQYGEIWGYTTDRFYTTADFDADGNLLPGIPRVKGVNPNPGDILFVDYDGDGEIWAADNTFNNPGDRRVIGNNSARFLYGITAGFGWKDFDLSLFLNGVGKRDLWMPNYWGPNSQFITSVFDYQMNYWTEDNVNSYWPKAYGVGGNNGANQKVQTKYLRDASFLRLKNITLSYNLPQIWCQRLTIQNLKVFVSGENLYTWHHLPTGFYPDAYAAVPGSRSMLPGVTGDSGSGAWSYPLMRQVSFGINLTF